MYSLLNNLPQPRDSFYYTLFIDWSNVKDGDVDANYLAGNWTFQSDFSVIKTKINFFSRLELVTFFSQAAPLTSPTLTIQFEANLQLCTTALSAVYFKKSFFCPFSWLSWFRPQRGGWNSCLFQLAHQNALGSPKLDIHNLEIHIHSRDIEIYIKVVPTLQMVFLAGERTIVLMPMPVIVVANRLIGALLSDEHWSAMTRIDARTAGGIRTEISWMEFQPLRLCFKTVPSTCE